MSGQRSLATCVLAAVMLLLASSDLSGQAPDRPPSTGAIVGAVLDAATGFPVTGATVVVQPDAIGVFPGPATGSAFATATRTASSDAMGGYRFHGLAPGAYRVYVSRYGYRPYSVVVELRGDDAAVSVALDADPIALDPLRARAHPRGPFERRHGFADDPELTRLMAADMRRRQFLTTDVRELTYTDVVEAVTLGEPDVFRALQRLPGVTTRSDYTAELWTRGAPWGHTRVYYDGVPLLIRSTPWA